MKKETLNSIITNEITDRLTQVVEEMSTNEFVDMIVEKYFVETNQNVDEDEVREMIGDKVLPLYQRLSEYIVEYHLKK